MRSRRILPPICVCMAIAIAPRLEAQEAFGPDAISMWDINAYLSLHYDHYDTDGDPAQAVFPTEGGHGYSEFDLQANRRFSAFETLGLEMSGLVNASDYRLSSHEGVIFERFNLRWEKGDAAVPFRFQAGDYFADISPRTLSRSLRGAEVDLQPAVGNGRSDVSAVFFAGRPSGIYKHANEDFGEDLYFGFSGLLLDPRIGALNANLVHNYRERDRAAGFGRRDQTVFSIAGERGFGLAGQAFTAEAEGAYFTGDHTDTGTQENGREDTGLFASLNGYSLTAPLTYSLVYERYGADFRPNGKVVSADRETVDGRAGWRFDNGIAANARALHVIDALESSNERRTRTAGLSLSGPLPGGLVPGATGYWDTFYSDARNEARTVDTDTLSSRLDLNFPAGRDLLIRFGANFLEFNDDNARDSTSYGVTLAADRNFSLEGWSGVISPEVHFRDRSGLSALEETGAGISLVAHRGGHAVDLSAGIGYFDARTAGGTDSFSEDATGRYSYRRGVHTFGVEAEYHGRSPDPGRNGESYRIGAFYTLQFHKPAGSLSRGRFIEADEAETGTRTFVGSSGVDLAALHPGLAILDVRTGLGRDGVSAPVAVGDVLVYDVTAFPRLAERQRLALVPEAGRVSRAVLIVDLDPTGRPETALRTLERVREHISRFHGPPDRALEEGAFTGAIEADVNSGRVVRVYEWRTDRGILRAGFPRRSDRTVRIEVAFGRDLPPIDQRFWSLGAVR